MPPVLRSDDRRNTVIRPLAYCREEDIARFAALMKYPIIPCDLCGSQENLKRRRVKRLVQELQEEIPGIRDSILASLGHVVPSHLLDTRCFDFKGLSAQSGDVQAELDDLFDHQHGLLPFANRRE